MFCVLCNNEIHEQEAFENVLTTSGTYPAHVRCVCSEFASLCPCDMEDYDYDEEV